MGAPVKHTCPDIDAVINAIDAAISKANRGREIVDSYSNEDDCFKEIIQTLKPLEKELEQLRHANASLRIWGEELEEKVCQLEKDVEYEEKQVTRLEGVIEDLKYEIEQLEAVTE